MLFLLVPGGFSDLKYQNNENSNWKKILGSRNIQEKLEKSWTLLRATTLKIKVHFPKMNFNSNVAARSKVQLFSAKQSKNRSQEKIRLRDRIEDPTQLQLFLTIKEIRKKKLGVCNQLTVYKFTFWKQWSLVYSQAWNFFENQTSLV